MAGIVLFGGDDTYYGGSTADSISGLAGNDFIVGGSGSDTLFGGLGNDVLQDGSAGDKDIYWGGAGDDTLNAGFGDFGDVADGGAGVDTISLHYAAFTLGGLSVVFGSSFFVLAAGAQGISVQNCEAMTIAATTFADLIQSGNGNDRIHAGDGLDSVYGGGGDDYIDAGTGDFDLDGGLGNDILALVTNSTSADVTWVVRPNFASTLVGFSGNARGFESLHILTGAGNDHLTGGALEDRFNTGDGNDQLYGGQGNDILGSGRGSDRVLGGDGDDFITQSGVFETGANGDTVFGGLGNDQIFGGDRDEDLSGDDGNDVLSGSYGLDILKGGAGNDTLFGGSQAAFYGGQNDDLVSVSLTGVMGILSGGTGTDLLLGYQNFNDRALVLETDFVAGGYQVTLGGVVVVVATGFEAVGITGGEQGDTLRGGAFDDQLTGYQYDGPASDTDSLYGLAGNDRLTGRAGVDRLFGGVGGDDLSGGLDADILFGGLDADVFRYTTLADSGPGPLRDIIRDFSVVDDTIDLSAIDADSIDPLLHAFIFIGRTAFSGAAGELRFTANLTRTMILGDVDGDAVADFEIQLDGKHILTSADFVL